MTGGDGFEQQVVCRFCGRSVTWELPFCLACRYERWARGVCLWCDAAVPPGRKVGGLMVCRCEACKHLPDAPNKGPLRFRGNSRDADRREDVRATKFGPRD